MHCSYAAIDFMATVKRGRGGVVVNVSSETGLDYMFCIPSYVATKKGIIMDLLNA